MALTETPSTLPAPTAPPLAAVGELVRPIAWAGERTLPVRSSVQGLFPGNGLRRGSTVLVAGSMSLVLASMAAASAEGSWCAVVGIPTLGAPAAAGIGIDLSRLVLVPDPGPQWAVVVAGLLDALDVVVVRSPGSARADVPRRLAARARERGAVLVVVPAAGGGLHWQADVHLRCESIHWDGLAQGCGRLRSQRLQVTATGRGAASRPRSASVATVATS